MFDRVVNTSLTGLQKAENNTWDRPRKFKICSRVNPLSIYPTKWSNTFKQFVSLQPTSCLSVFDHFVGLVLKDLMALAHPFDGSVPFLYPLGNLGKPKVFSGLSLVFRRYRNGALA